MSRLALGLMQSPPVQQLPAAFSTGIKRPGWEADHLLPRSVEVKNEWIYTSTPHTHYWRVHELHCYYYYHHYYYYDYY
jgi:hypothetical protein